MQENQAVDYLNTTAASALLGVSRQWLNRLADAGRVPGAVIHAGYRLFDRAAFEPWAAEQKARRKRSLVNRP